MIFQLILSLFLYNFFINYYHFPILRYNDLWNLTRRDVINSKVKKKLCSWMLLKKYMKNTFNYLLIIFVFLFNLHRCHRRQSTPDGHSEISQQGSAVQQMCEESWGTPEETGGWKWQGEVGDVSSTRPQGHET